MNNTVLAIMMALISGLLATMVATIVTLYWQKRTATYNRKMKVFETLMIYRDLDVIAHLKETVPAFNSIDVIFYDDRDVRDAYKDFINEANKPEEMHPNIKDKHLRLLEVMANSLGLKKIGWEDIKNPYSPKGYNELLKDEEAMRKTAIANNIMCMKFINEFHNTQSPKEEKTVQISK